MVEVQAVEVKVMEVKVMGVKAVEVKMVGIRAAKEEEVEAEVIVVLVDHKVVEVKERVAEASNKEKVVNLDKVKT